MNKLRLLITTFPRCDWRVSQNISWCRPWSSCNIDRMLRLLVFTLLLGCSATLADIAEIGAGQPAYVLQLPDSVEDVVIVETDTSTLYRYGQGQNSVEVRDTAYVSIGENGVGKNRSWDRRTPLGIYFVRDQLDTTRLHEKYGPTAFPLDYPNIRDRLMKRSGDGIWIHGVASNGGRRPPLDTDGCIALPNDELLALADKLVPLVTPVIIVREMRWRDPGQIAVLRDDLTNALENWAQSYRSGDLHGYLSMYAESFEFRGMPRSEWAAFRMATFATAVSGFVLDQVLLLADPEDANLYLSRFRQRISDGEGTVETIKRLYWQRSADGELRIVAEDNG